MTISRRVFLLCLLCLSLALPLAAKDSPKKTYLLFVGTYTEKDSKGIYAYRYDATSSKLTPLGLAAETVNPSFLAIHPNGNFLYAVNETPTYKGVSSGAVSAFAIDRKTGKLTLLNQTASHGADPCHLSFDKTGKFALVANYTGGNVAVLPIQSDGRLSEASSVIRDAGALGPNKERQEAPHSHWIEASPQNRFVYVSDLGLDRVLIYRFDVSKGALTSGESESAAATSPSSDGTSNSGESLSVALAPGTGPRHAALSADGSVLYVLGELDSSVTVFAKDRVSGNERESLHSVQRISALPDGFTGHNDAAEIAIHPNGKFLYTSNRGDDSIAVFSIERRDGKLRAIGHTPTEGKAPRHFAIDPTGRRLFVANQQSGMIVVFSINPKNGLLKATGESVNVPLPVSLQFAMAE